MKLSEAQRREELKEAFAGGISLNKLIEVYGFDTSKYKIADYWLQVLDEARVEWVEEVRKEIISVPHNWDSLDTEWFEGETKMKESILDLPSLQLPSKDDIGKKINDEYQKKTKGNLSLGTNGTYNSSGPFREEDKIEWY